MNVIVCLDDRQGMMFCNRRQSQDRKLRERIVQRCNGILLWMNAYSYKLYEEMTNDFICVDENFLSKAQKGEFCLVESALLKPYENKIEKLIVFWWNRHYPADFYLDLDLKNWKKEREEEFQGSSHENITEEIYTKKEKNG